jgi:DNA-binding NarL/FixJ family response regulator
MHRQATRGPSKAGPPSSLSVGSPDGKEAAGRSGLPFEPGLQAGRRRPRRVKRPLADDPLFTLISAPASAGCPNHDGLAVVAPHELLRHRIVDALRRDRLAPEVVVGRIEALPDDPPRVLLVATGRALKARDALLRALGRRLPETLVVLVAERDSRMSVRAAVDAGVSGVVFADELESALAPTVRAVVAGQTVVPRDRRREIDPPTLSARERQVIELVAEGLSNQEIGRTLFLAEATVKSHLSVVFRKLGVRSRSEVAALVLDRADELGLGWDGGSARAGLQG